MNAHVFHLSLDFSYCSSEVFECFSRAQACVHSSPLKDCSVYFVLQLNTVQAFKSLARENTTRKYFTWAPQHGRETDTFFLAVRAESVIDLQEQVTRLRNLLGGSWTKEKSSILNSLVAPLFHVVITVTCVLFIKHLQCSLTSTNNQF